MTGWYLLLLQTDEERWAAVDAAAADVNKVMSGIKVENLPPPGWHLQQQQQAPQQPQRPAAGPPGGPPPGHPPPGFVFVSGMGCAADLCTLPVVHVLAVHSSWQIQRQQ